MVSRSHECGSKPSAAAALADMPATRMCSPLSRHGLIGTLVLGEALGAVRRRWK
jgi:hypothetical protein